MPKFTVRVTLKDIPAEHVDYVRLHMEMAEQGFRRTVAGDGGRVYQLPPGEYDLDAEHSKELVCVMARAAAEKLGRPFSVFVTKATSRVWFGLDVVQG